MSRPRQPYTEVQFNKLPRWAQDLVTRSQREVEHMQARLDAALESAGFTDIADDYAVFPATEKAVRFRLDPGAERPYIEVRLDTHDGQQGIAVHCYDGCSIRPAAANAVFIGNVAP